MLSIANVEWKRGEADFLSGRYSRAHTVSFDGGVCVPGSSSPAVVPLPLSIDEAVDPEEMFVASISACHMLWFLDLARHARVDVQSYTDQATGELTKEADGRSWVSRVTLHPDVRCAAPVAPGQLDALHHQAHQACFIANSVKTAVSIAPVHNDHQEERHHG